MAEIMVVMAGWSGFLGREAESGFSLNMGCRDKLT